jgi:hypothetical protein
MFDKVSCSLLHLGESSLCHFTLFTLLFIANINLGMTITKKIIAVKKKIKKCRKKLYTKQKCKQWYTNEAPPRRHVAKAVAFVAKSARHQWRQQTQRRQKCQAPMATTDPTSPKVPGTNGDING